MGLSRAFNQCIFSLLLLSLSLSPSPSLSLLCHHSLINLKALWGCNIFVGGGGSAVAVGVDGVGEVGGSG